MILDHLSNADRYKCLGERLAIALGFLRDPASSRLEPAAIGTDNSLKIELCGSDVFALVQRYTTKTPTKAFWEAHRRYIDVQCIIEGEELMGHMPLQFGRSVKPYDSTRDFEEFASEDATKVNHVRVAASMFAIFMPHDVHMPGLCVNNTPAMVKKIVMKVAV